MDALTIHEAAETTGWSPRMLRYIERSGSSSRRARPPATGCTAPRELQRLRTLRELLERFDVGLGDVGFALRLRRDRSSRRGGGVVRGRAAAARGRPRRRLAALGAGQAHKLLALAAAAAADDPPPDRRPTNP